jgi:hypothetical protein
VNDILFTSLFSPAFAEGSLFVEEFTTSGEENPPLHTDQRTRAIKITPLSSRKVPFCYFSFSLNSNLRHRVCLAPKRQEIHMIDEMNVSIHKEH